MSEELSNRLSPPEVGAFVRSQHNCVRLFVSGAQSHVGKTTVCLGILGYLRHECGLAAEELAYIKPATQCEARDLLAAWCAREGVAYVAGAEAPVVFYAGFTRAVLAGEATASLDAIAARIDALCEKRRVVVIDGVGFPGVGSTVGASNADVAAAARAPVVLVAPSGVGGAIDAHCLGAALFERAGVPVLGAILNRSPATGFYAKDAVAGPVAAFFAQKRPRETLYGVVPALETLDRLREKVSALSTTRTDNDDDANTLDELAAANVRHVATHVDFAELIRDAALDVFNRKRATRPRRPAAAEGGSVASAAPPPPPPTSGRAEIEARARASGAPGAR